MLAAHAQPGLINRIGRWTGYLGHRNTKEITGMNGLVYFATNGGFYKYDPATEATYPVTKVNGLSGTEPTTIYADTSSGLLFLGFSDGMINTVDDNLAVSYISDIERSNNFTTKGIVRMQTHEQLLYIATRFGVVVFDPERRETRFSMTKIGVNPTGSELFGLCIADGRIWAAMGSRGVWSAEFNDPDFGLPEAWTRDSVSDGLPNVSVTTVVAEGERVFALVNDSIYVRPPGGPWQRSAFPTANYNSLGASDGNVYATYRPSFMALLRPNGTLETIDRQGTVTCGYVEGEMIILGDATVGFSRNGAGTSFYGSAPAGPKNNFVTDMAAGDGGLYIAPRGKNGASGRFYDRSGIPYFGFHDNGWHINDTRSGDLDQNGVWRDFARATYHPATQRCFVGSWGDGMVELKEGRVLRTYSAINSGLTPSSTGDHRVSGLAFDDQGNLWISQMINSYALNMMTPDSQWYAFDPYPGIYPVGLATDTYGNKWIVDQDHGIVVFNDNFTPDDPSDDRVREINSSFGRGGLPNNSVRSLALDHDQQMWIGTTDGVTIMYDPSLMFSSDFQDAACPLIDGYCLLRGQEVFDIAVDGANRKWLGTNTGVYMVNIDGTQLLAHYTEENSPLLSDVVVSVEIDQSTGEVFFGTSKGVISFMGESIAGQADAEALYAFPNPVPWYHDGPIMIKGMRSFSKVKIATVAGEVVRELESLGGELPWDGLDAFGRKVNPGVYVIMVADPDGNGANITKLVILEHPK